MLNEVLEALQLEESDLEKAMQMLLMNPQMAQLIEVASQGKLPEAEGEHQKAATWDKEKFLRIFAKANAMNMESVKK